MKEINTLILAGKVSEAKDKYKQLVEKKKEPDIERAYIHFLFEQKQFLDFRRTAKDFLRRYPEDQDIKLLQFEYYAKLATDAEKQGSYRMALDYIVTWLLSPDYPQYRKWESRQATVLKKWYQDAEAKNDLTLQREILVRMRNLGFDNLAMSLAPELYQSMEDQAKNQ